MISQELHEYLEKIIQVGETGECPVDLLGYFIKDYPNTRGAYLRHTVWAQSVPITRLPSLIKGCHLIELKYREVKGNDFGFGSTSRTKDLIEDFHKREPELAERLYDWVGKNGGNYFILVGTTYVDMKLKQKQREKRQATKLAQDQEAHKQAVEVKGKRSEAHIINSKEHNEMYLEFQNKFHSMTDNELMDARIKQMGNSGWTGTRAVYMSALHQELDKRRISVKEIEKRKLMKLVCPKCGSKKILSILYGLIREPSKIDESKYYLAGCEDEGYQWHCTECLYEWENSGQGQFAEIDQ